MIRATMLAIVAVLALQSQDSLANHITDAQMIAVKQALEAKDDALQALIDDLQAQIDALHPPSKTVFVTSEAFDGNLGGLTGADATCQALADDPSSIVPPGTYLAWLSDTSGDAPKFRFTRSSDPYVLPGGLQVASDYNNLTDGIIDRPINIDETGAMPSTNFKVWTNTAESGAVVFLLTQFVCDDWLSANSGIDGFSGDFRETVSAWTVNIGRPCNTPNRLYCFQQ